MFAVQRINTIRTALTRTAISRHYVAVAEPKQYHDPEWSAAKSYDTLPKQSLLAPEFLPGGKLFKSNLDDLQNYLQKKHGPIVRIPGILGRPEMVWLYDPDDFQKVYRTEGPWPYRKGFDSVSYWKQHVKPELFNDFQGLVDE